MLLLMFLFYVKKLTFPTFMFLLRRQVLSWFPHLFCIAFLFSFALGQAILHIVKDSKVEFPEKVLWIVLSKKLKFVPIFYFFGLPGSCKCWIHQETNMLRSCANKAEQGRFSSGGKRETKGRLWPGCCRCSWTFSHSILR